MHANGDMKHCAIIQSSRLYLFISSATLFCYGGEWEGLVSIVDI